MGAQILPLCIFQNYLLPRSTDNINYLRDQKCYIHRYPASFALVNTWIYLLRISAILHLIYSKYYTRVRINYYNA